MPSQSAPGYVIDVPYTFHFARELAPAWLDFVVTLSGFEAPSRAGNFAWCELGCGQGVSAAIMAGTHPTGEFHGIDVFPAHIQNAQRLCGDAGIANLTLHAIDFASAIDLDLPTFDYIVAHGVYSWIDSRGREDMRRFIDRRLKPGGLAYVSYNAMPGWANDTPFQYLVRELAAASAGDGIAQFLAAMNVIEALTAAGAMGLRSSFMATSGWEEQRKTLAMSYFVHEYLPQGWQPLYVSQVRPDMARIGLVPAGSATIRDNFDSFVLRRAARDALAAMSDGDLRDLARDFFLNQRFRRDVFVRGARRLDDEERRRRLAESMFGLQRPADKVEFGTSTEAGRLSFDNDSARAIVAALRSGPKRLVDIESEGSSPAKLLASALALFAANDIRPVGPASVDVGKLNTALVDYLDETDTLRVVALPAGTAVAIPFAFLHAMQEGAPLPDELLPWSEFLRFYGV